MPKYPHENISTVPQRLLAGMRNYRKLVGVKNCLYNENDIDACIAIVDAYLTHVSIGKKLSQKTIRDAVKKTVLDLNALNEKCGHKLIETDQREDLCLIILVGAQKAGLETDEDITEEWRDW